MKNSIANYRILDANANRAVEGLRTLEEVARFHLDHSGLTSNLKQLRHELQETVDRLGRLNLLTARDTAHDVGTQVTTPSEYQRADLAAIVGAASGRVQQALRCLEEFSKPLDAEIAASFEALRYRSYDLLAAIELQTRSKPFPENGRLYLLLDCSRPIMQLQSWLSHWRIRESTSFNFATSRLTIGNCWSTLERSKEPSKAVQRT